MTHKPAQLCANLRIDCMIIYPGLASKLRGVTDRAEVDPTVRETGFYLVLIRYKQWGELVPYV